MADPLGWEVAPPKLKTGADEAPNKPWLAWELESCVAPPKLMDGAGVAAPKVKEVDGCEPPSLPKLKEGGADVVPGAAKGLPPVGPPAAEKVNEDPPPAAPVPKMEPVPPGWLADCCDGAVVLPKLNMLELGGGAAGVVLPNMGLEASGWLVRVAPKSGFAAPGWLAGVAPNRDDWEVVAEGAGVEPKIGFASAAGVDELAAPKRGLLSEGAAPKSGLLSEDAAPKSGLLSEDAAPKSGLLSADAGAGVLPNPKTGPALVPKAGLLELAPKRLEGGAAAGVSLDESFPNMDGAWEAGAGVASVLG
jgi:hypothetical protein